MTDSSPLPPPALAPEGELTPERVDEHIAGAFEIAEFLKKNVVQGVRTDEGNYCESLPCACRSGAAVVADSASRFTLSLLTIDSFLARPDTRRDSCCFQLSESTKKPNEATTTRSRRKPRSRPRSRTSTCAGGDGERATQQRRPLLPSQSAAVVAERRTPQHSMGKP